MLDTAFHYSGRHLTPYNCTIAKIASVVLFMRWMPTSPSEPWTVIGRHRLRATSMLLRQKLILTQLKTLNVIASYKDLN